MQVYNLHVYIHVGTNVNRKVDAHDPSIRCQSFSQLKLCQIFMRPEFSRSHFIVSYSLIATADWPLRPGV